MIGPAVPSPLSRTRLLAEAERAWAEVDAALDGLDEAALAVAGDDGWSINDHLVHLTGWDRVLLALLEGRPAAPAIGLDEMTYAEAGIDEVNDRIRRSGAAKSSETILREWRQTRDEIRRAVERFDGAALERPVADWPGAEPLPMREWIHGTLVDHYAEHLACIDRLTPAKVGMAERDPFAGDEVTVSRVLGEVDAAWAELIDLVDGAGGEALSRPGAGGRAAKDILIHLATWERSLLALLDGTSRALAVGIDPDRYAELDEDGINAIIFERHRERAAGDLLGEAKATHALVRARLAELSDADLLRPYSSFQPGDPTANPNPVLAWILGNTAGHYRGHLPEIGGRLVGG